MIRHRAFPLAVVAAALLCRGGDEAGQRIVGRTFGPTPLLADVQELCDRVGGRPTGSPACERAIEWATGKFRSAGADQRRYGDVHYSERVETRSVERRVPQSRILSDPFGGRAS